MLRKQAAKLHLLSAREVLAAGEGDLADGGGLLLRIRGPSETFVYRFTAASGRRREMGFGVVHRGSLKQAGDSLAAARDRAYEARELVKRGSDPIYERDGRRRAAREADRAKKDERQREQMTLARAARGYHERVIEPTRSAKHGANWIASLEHHIPASIWHAPIASITPPALLVAMSTVSSMEKSGEKIPETLQRMRQRLDAVFEDAMFHGLCATNPAAAVRRKLREAMPRHEGGHLGALPYREAPAFMQQLRPAQGIAARCLEFSILTACRTSESLLATWQEFDLDASLWVIPKERMKAKEEHVVHLSPRAIEILQGQRDLDARYPFPSPVLPGRPMSNMAMLNVLERMGQRAEFGKDGKCIRGTTVHGLCRATFSTWANETAAARPDVIEGCLAHEEANRVRAAYNRAKFNEERRALLDAWAEYLATPVGSNVVPLRVA